MTDPSEAIKRVEAAQAWRSEAQRLGFRVNRIPRTTATLRERLRSRIHAELEAENAALAVARAHRQKAADLRALLDATGDGMLGMLRALRDIEASADTPEAGGSDG